MKKIGIGILAHVDAGKTTLSEGLLYESGSIRRIGRVDNGDAFLDTHALERARGITIFSKQAIFSLGDAQVTLLDTPGHVDFSSEMERTLQVLDYAILLISGSDGIQAHTQTLWYLLRKYKIPVFLFINKMDQSGTDKDSLLTQLQRRFGDGCIDFQPQGTGDFYENIAMTDETALEYYLEHGSIEPDHIRRLIRSRTVFPCFFGSALKLSGIREFLEGMETYISIPHYPAEFGARVFKIARDEQGNRLTHLKVTGGSLSVRMALDKNEDHKQPEKVNQIRIYSGSRYETVSEAEAGTICAVTGLDTTYPGEGIGIEADDNTPLLVPVLRYGLLLPDGCDAASLLPKLRQLEEEDPALHLIWNEASQEIQCQIMGEVQIEVLKTTIEERFGICVEFDAGSIVYRETIADTTIGVGHFEPLRHYAEVLLLLEPLTPGSGLQFDETCSVDVLERNWQRLILTHLKEKEHKGVLTGAPVTDLKITLLAGRSHPKHTEGGDFRQATYRAVRQGLKQAVSVLLEPFYAFQMEMPEAMAGRTMTDIKRMHGSFEAPECKNGMAELTGQVPAATFRGYQTEFLSYTKGEGKLFLQVAGYRPCHNAEEVIEELAYDSEKDFENPTGSVFCSHGAGFPVSWDKVPEYQHVAYKRKTEIGETLPPQSVVRNRPAETWIGDDEVEKIFARTFYANSQEKPNRHKKYAAKTLRTYSSSEHMQPQKKEEPKEEYLLVDGYNIIFAWDELKELAKETIDGARGRLMDILCNYQAVKKIQLILVFDAYRVEGHKTELMEYQNIHVVFTKEAETADQYIEKFSHQNREKYAITVATSDGLEQIIIRSQGCLILSAANLLEEIERTSKLLHEEYLDRPPSGRSYMLDGLSDAELKQVRDTLQKMDAET